MAFASGWRLLGRLPGFRHVDRLAAGALRVWLVAGILLRVTRVRDRFEVFELVFYTTPWPVIAACFAILGVRAHLHGGGHPVRRYILLTAGALFTWIATSWYSAPVPTHPVDLKLVHWNVDRPDTLLPMVSARLGVEEADVICVSEAQPQLVSTLDRWRAAFPEYRALAGPGELLCLVRGEALSVSRGELSPGSYFSQLRLSVRGRQVNVLQVDVNAQLGRSRQDAIQRITQMARAGAGGNLLIVGDFNLPRESAHFDPLRRDFVQCFEAAGTGLAETWPRPWLALTLDQVWAGAAWKPVSARNGWSWMSDHRPVIVELSNAATGGSEPPQAAVRQ